MAHTYNPSYSGDSDEEDLSSKPATGKYFAKPYLKNSQYKKGQMEWLKSL
jgi:hypothetical protein